MTEDAAPRRSRAKQVGMLMRAHRHAYPVESGARRLSQNGVLDLMAQVDGSYAGRHDHSTVVRWESGAIYPTRERLEVFGRALDLSRTEIDGLISLAGLDADAVTSKPTRAQTSVEPANTREAVSTDVPKLPPRRLAAAFGAGESSSYVGYAIRYARSRFLLPGLAVALVGYFLALLSWNSSFVLVVYVGVAICALAAQGFLRLRRSDDLGELLSVTVFVQLSVNLLPAPLTRMDYFGFYAIGGFAGTSIPFTLALIASLLIAMVAGLIFDFLWRWQYSGTAGEKGVHIRAVWIVLPPIAFVYACLLAFANAGAWIVGLGVYAVLAGVFTALVVLRDEDVSIDALDQKFMLWAAVTLTIVLSALGGAAILMSYLEPNLFGGLHHGVLLSWDIDFDALGYPQEEYIERFRLSATWASLATLAYLVVVIGGKLIVTIYRLDGGDSSPTASATADSFVATSSTRRTTRHSRVDLRYRPGWLTAHRILRYGRNR